MLLQLEKENENHINNKEILWGQSREVDIGFSTHKDYGKKLRIEKIYWGERSLKSKSLRNDSVFTFLL